VIGEARFEGSPVLFSRTEQDNCRSAPLLGEDTAHVCTTLLGMDPDEVAALTEEGVL
jgi:crotonobetainyl-CoA:carnitine CoA-transferase CaiB-like acyl-CoA transferase